jgi:hypothetical protein
MLRGIYPYLVLGATLCAAPVAAVGAKSLEGDGPERVIRRVYVWAPAFVADATVGNGFFRQPHYANTLSGWVMWRHATTTDVMPETFGTHPTSRRLSFGAGLRLTHFRTQREAEFAGRAAAEGSSLLIEAPRLTALNVAVQLRLRLANWPEKHPIGLGFNIDLGGLSFGPTRSVQPTASTTSSSPNEIRPVRGNLLLGNKNDRGTLNSELFITHNLTPRLTIRVGWAHIASGYALDGNRYQRFSNLAFIGLSYGVGGVWRYY